MFSFESISTGESDTVPQLTLALTPEQKKILEVCTYSIFMSRCAIGLMYLLASSPVIKVKRRERKA